ncbi:MAG TPA: histidine kinase dimerization/phospho-acceptor domain-containing protein, partial [Gemmataceae bacterium]|nr:histidine kinase dimerization/phospho-acceptor domain-containing protein [Gemmataceae bacterium]
MTGEEQTERSAKAGLHPEPGKVGNRLRDHLTATLAHELRDPLASVLAALQVMRHGGADEAAARQAHDRAERQVRHMARIIEDVLEICRAGEGKLSLRKERVDLAAVVAG